MNKTTIETLMAGHEALFFDAYGVLVAQGQAMPGALALLQHLNARRYPYWILTNGAARSLTKTAEHYQELGLPIQRDRVITSGSLLVDCFKEEHWRDARTVVLGTEDTAAFVREGGGIIHKIGDAGSFDIVVIANQTGFPFLESLDWVLSRLFDLCEQGKPPAVVVANPDLIFHKNRHEFGFTSGAMALLLRQALLLRFGTLPTRWLELGKPAAPIFNKAMQYAGTTRIAMIGDQIETDIVGANRAGLTSVLYGGGLIDLASLAARADIQGDKKPQYLLTDLDLNGGR